MQVCLRINVILSNTTLREKGFFWFQTMLNVLMNTTFYDITLIPYYTRNIAACNNTFSIHIFQKYILTYIYVQCFQCAITAQTAQPIIFMNVDIKPTSQQQVQLLNNCEECTSGSCPHLQGIKERLNEPIEVNKVYEVYMLMLLYCLILHVDTSL